MTQEQRDELEELRKEFSLCELSNHAPAAAKIARIAELEALEQYECLEMHSVCSRCKGVSCRDKMTIIAAGDTRLVVCPRCTNSFAKWSKGR